MPSAFISCGVLGVVLMGAIPSDDFGTTAAPQPPTVQAADAPSSPDDTAAPTPPAEPEAPEATSKADVPVRTGWGVQGLPLANFNSDDGFGYGARLMVVDRADGTWAPYRYAITAQFFQTTGGVGFHRLIFDAPRLLGTPWRVSVEGALQIERFAPYYGIGNTTEHVPAYETCAREALLMNPDECPGNPEFRGRRYYAYEERTLPRISVNLQRQIHGAWRAYVGHRLRITTVTPTYTRDDLGQSRDGRLLEDAKAGELTGYDGQSGDPFTLRTGELQVGLLYDTRDNEPAPNAGMYHDLSVRVAAVPTGSQYTYGGATNVLRFYVPVVRGPRPLVAAARVFHDVMWGDIPFTAMRSLGGFDFREYFGGLATIRGLPKNRYAGAVKQILNAEIRWTPFVLTPFNQTLAFTVLAGADAGRVWRDLTFSDGGGHTVSGVGGLRIAWNENFIVRIDYGRAFTTKTSALYIDFGHMF